MSTTTTDREFYNVPELAQLLNCGTRFIYRLVDERRIPHFKIGKHLRFSASDVNAFIKSCHVAAVRGPVSPR